jgi:hypothetical protein
LPPNETVMVSPATLLPQTFTGFDRCKTMSLAKIGGMVNSVTCASLEASEQATSAKDTHAGEHSRRDTANRMVLILGLRAGWLP